MNIFCVIHSLDGGGAERVLASLASRMARAGHAVTLVTLDDGSRSKHEIDATVGRMPLDCMAVSHGWIDRVRNTRARVRSIRAALRAGSPDVVLSFCDRTNILALLAARPLSIPVVVSERSDPAQQHLGWAWERLRDRTYRHAAAIVALTDTAAAHLQERFSVPVAVIPSAVDRPPFQSDRAIAVSNRRILGIGRLEPEKGFDRLVEAFARIAPAHPEWELRILGEGSRRPALTDQIHRLGLEDRVTLPGWIQPVWPELGAATIFALPSRYEGFPSALLEAMAMGVPSVAVDCESGPRAVIGDSGQAKLVPNDVAGLASGLSEWIEADALREQFGRGGTHVVERFSWESMVRHYLDLLRRVSSGTDSEQSG